MFAFDLCFAAAQAAVPGPKTLGDIGSMSLDNLCTLTLADANAKGVVLVSFCWLADDEVCFRRDTHGLFLTIILG
jgi:hypothetical protein